MDSTVLLSAGWLTPKRVLALRERFMAFSRGVDCQVWDGAPDQNGYGRVAYTVNGKSRQTSAHRMSWLLSVGDIAEGMVIDHLCRNRMCVNIDHLEPVSSHENLLRGAIPLVNRDGLSYKRRVPLLRIGVLCPRGHELTELTLNVILSKHTTERRECRVCRRDYMRDYMRSYKR